MLKLTPFHHHFKATFLPKKIKSAKDTDRLDCFFALFGYTTKKLRLRKYVSEIDPCSPFINVLQASFTCADSKRAKRNWQLDWIYTLLGSSCVNPAHKTLVKSTPGYYTNKSKVSTQLEATKKLYHFLILRCRLWLILS